MGKKKLAPDRSGNVMVSPEKNFMYIFFHTFETILKHAISDVLLSFSGEHILHFLVLVTGCTSAGKLGSSEIYRYVI